MGQATAKALRNAIWGLGLAWIPCSTALAGSMELRIAVGADGVSILSALPVAAEPDPIVPGAPTVDVLDEAGARIGVASVPDPRVRSVIAPDGSGHGQAATLVSGVARVRVPWTDAARSLRYGATPLALPPRATEAHPRPAPPRATLILDSGPAAERLDLVFLGDGYTASQQDDFGADVDRMVEYLLSIEPYGAYSNLFNVWKIEVDSNQSGASHEELSPPQYRDTALSCFYGCGGIDRLTCCDDATVLGIVGDAVPGADGIMVLINDPTYGGSGGFTYATSYVGEDYGPQVAAHELGHSLIGLWDEYGYGGTGAGDGPNCVADPSGGWDSWVGTNGVDAYPECSWSNLVRPTKDQCMMRTLQDDYCPVCRQEAVLAMYRRLPGLVSQVTPAPGALDARDTERGDVRIDVSTHGPSDALDIRWLLDGEEVGRGARLEVSCSGLNGGLSVSIDDPTPWVRDDPDGLLSQTIGPWQVQSERCARTPEETVLSCATGPAPLGGALFLLALAAVRRRG